MSTVERTNSHASMDSVVGYILLIGVISSAALIVGGLAWHWATTGQLQFEYPIGRVNLASVLYFAFVARNWKYALFTASVLGALTYSLFGR
jgi:hypothetical protein